MEQEATVNKVTVIKRHTNSGSAVYGLGLIGALIYFIQNANTLGAGVLGFFKALVWPAYAVYYLFKAFGI